MDETIEIVAGREDHGSRFDVFLSGHARISRSHAVRLIEKGDVMVDRQPRRPSFRLKAGMQVHGAWSTAEHQSAIEAFEVPLPIMYEDPWIVVVDKPAGLVVHPGAGTHGHTLVHALLARYPEIRGVGDSDRPGIVHRLDKLTSGVMMVARDSASHAALVSAFKAHEHRREYLAVCYGGLEDPQGTIETFMQRSRRDRKKMTSRTQEGKRAVTHWKVLERWDEFSLLRLTLETGRTHQIRVHLADAGHPVAGDAQYGGRKRTGSILDPVVRDYVSALGRQMLHAALLGIRHPATGEYMEFTSPMPPDMEGFIAVLDGRRTARGNP